jgi:hypothetical protein
MKRVPSALVLKSAASAFVLCLLAAGTRAQQAGSLELRNGDSYLGPVQSVRAEGARFVKQDGALVEGPRVLIYTISYSEDGKRREEQGYASDGTPCIREVTVYDDQGRSLEFDSYAGRDRLVRKIVHRPDEGETLYYDGEERLQRRVVTLFLEDDVREFRIFNGDGSLSGTYVRKRVEGGFDSKDLDENGVVRAEFSRRHRTLRVEVVEGQGYAPFRSPCDRAVAPTDAVENGVPVPRPEASRGPRFRQKKERDERGNGLKLTNYVWDADARDFVPAEVFYFKVTYYR